MTKLMRLLLIVLIAVLPVAVAGPAGATSCAADPGATPQKLLAGRKVFDKPLFAGFDLAVVGTVTGIRSNEAQGGATRTTLDVHSAFNVGTLPPTIDVSSDDPGWMNGYAFERGSTYFVPLVHPGPQGQPHYSFVCDPITKLPGPDAAAELETIAADNDVTIAQLAAPAAPETAPAAAAGLSLVRVAVIGGLAVLALLGVGALAMVAGRRRQSA